MIHYTTDSPYIPKPELSLYCCCLCRIPVLYRFVLRAFALRGSSIHPDMCSPFSCPSSTGNTGSHTHCSPTTYHTLSHKHLLRPRQGMKKARLPTQASLWVTDALCTINHIQLGQFRTKSDNPYKWSRGAKSGRKTSDKTPL